jgi:F0F1-type ATP synthase membrane subunit b/b'
MPDNTNPQPQAEQSLVPMVREREEELRRRLEEARHTADEMVQQAEREAAERLAREQAELPRLLERQLAGAIQRLEAQAGERRQAAGRAGDRVREAAEQNMEAAVTAIVAAVWPRG